MAQPHHRKKHKEHLKNFQHRNDQTDRIAKKGKSTLPLAIIGAVGGLLLILFTVAAGYFIGHRLDKSV
jgi:hypothetical protein